MIGLHMVESHPMDRPDIRRSFDFLGDVDVDRSINALIRRSMLVPTIGGWTLSPHAITAFGNIAREDLAFVRLGEVAVRALVQKRETQKSASETSTATPDSAITTTEPKSFGL